MRAILVVFAAVGGLGAVGPCVGCAKANLAPSSVPGDEDPVANVRRENAALKRRVQLLEDRLLKLEREPGPRLRVVERGRKRVPAPAIEQASPTIASTSRAPSRPSRSVTLAPAADAAAPSEAFDTDEGFDATESATESDADGGRSYRLVGSRLVELTQTRGPSRPDRPERGGKGGAIVTEYEAAMALYRSADAAQAERAFERFARTYPKHDYADNALYWKGEAAYDQAHFSDALAAFTEVVERYGGGNKAPDALLKIGLCFDKIGDLDNARDVLRQLITAYPGARASDIARVRLAELEI
jgi:tol-pal system protein YbgF